MPVVRYYTYCMHYVIHCFYYTGIKSLRQEDSEDESSLQSTKENNSKCANTKVMSSSIPLEHVAMPDLHAWQASQLLQTSQPTACVSKSYVWVANIAIEWLDINICN